MDASFSGGDEPPFAFTDAAFAWGTAGFPFCAWRIFHWDWGLSHGKVGLDEKLWNEAKLWGLANWFSVLKLVFRVGQAFMVAIYL